jgi:outer membrane protein assembly factor BamA
VFFTSRNVGVSGVNFSRDSDDYEVTQQGNYILVSDEKKFLKLNTLINNTLVQSGAHYSDHAVERTYATLNALPPIRYVNVSFRDTGTDSLDCIITVAPAKLLSLTAEVEATYTDGFWGIATNLGTVHRNVFRGAESLSLQGRLAYEWQGEGVLANELGAQAGLLFPNFLMPFTTSSFRRNVRANTEFTISAYSQTRPTEFDVMRLRTGMRYRWSQSRFRHSFDLLDISYVNFNITHRFDSIFLEPGRFNRYNYEDHLITRIAYGGSYSSFNPNRPLQNHFALRYSIETAGNALYAFNSLFNSPKNADGFYTVVGNIPYSQYVRADFGITSHQIMDANNRFVYRFFVGAGTPYGNASVIPWERRYFAGGANSVRGWAESMLGPGSYQRDTGMPGRDYNQIGDIKLDLNMEYRYKMFGILDGALFIDAGNIWTVKPYAMQQGGEFRFNTFWRELGVAYGTGLRLDFPFLVARLDFGVKLHDPALPQGERWRTNLTSRDLALHFAIGYPF